MREINEAKRSSPLLGVLRVFWMVIGPAALAMLCFDLTKKGGGWMTGPDVAYLTTLALMLAARVLDFRSGNAMTTYGEPLTAVGLTRYLVVAGGLGLAAWVAANVVGNHWLT
jgi:hypothetical protein